MTTQARPILGLGTPKGGTRYVSRLLVASGVRALHETKGRDGQVSCYLVVDDWWNPHMSSGGKRSDYGADARLLHVLRHPLTAIASLVAWRHPEFWHWQQQHTDLIYRPTLRFAAAFWQKWHALIERQEPAARIRVEHAERDWPGVSAVLGISSAFPQVERDAAWDNPDKKPIQWEDLGDAAVPVREQAARYGYSI